VVANRKALSESYVHGLELREENYTVWDGRLPGFGVQITPLGVRSYVFKYTLNGRQGWITIGRAKDAKERSKEGVWTASEARERAQEMRKQIDKGLDPRAVKRREMDAPTMASLADDYISKHAKIYNKERSAKEANALVEKVIKPRLGLKRAKDVKQEDVEDLMRAMRTTPIRANRALSCLSKMFHLAEEWRIRDQNSNPCRFVKKYEERPRERFLNALELEALGVELEAREGEDPIGVGAIRLLVFTGARLTEVLELEWDRVDLQRNLLVISIHKTDQRGAKHLPLNQPAMEALGYEFDEKGAMVFDGQYPKRKANAVVRLLNNPYVFTGKDPGSHLVNLHSLWEEVRENAGKRLKQIAETENRLVPEVDISDVRIHDLRHCFASMGVSHGMSLPLIGKLLGHSQASTTQRYAHLASSPLQEASQEIAGRLAVALMPPKRN